MAVIFMQGSPRRRSEAAYGTASRNFRYQESTQAAICDFANACSGPASFYGVGATGLSGFASFDASSWLFSFGFTVERTTINLFNVLNQKGAPNETAMQ